MGRHFVKHYKTTCRRLANSLSCEEYGAFAKLSLYVRFRDNTVRSADGTPMTQEEIGKLLGYKERKTREILRCLVERGVLIEERKGKSKVYRINSTLCYCG